MHARFPELTLRRHDQDSAPARPRRAAAAAARRAVCSSPSAVESVDDEILDYLDKNHTRADFERALRLCRDDGISPRAHLRAVHAVDDAGGLPRSAARRWCACIWWRRCRRFSFPFACWCRRAPICCSCRVSRRCSRRSTRNCSVIRGGTPILAWTHCSRRCRPGRARRSARTGRAAKYSADLAARARRARPAKRRARRAPDPGEPIAAPVRALVLLRRAHRAATAKLLSAGHEARPAAAACRRLPQRRFSRRRKNARMSRSSAPPIIATDSRRYGA